MTRDNSGCPTRTPQRQKPAQGFCCQTSPRAPTPAAPFLVLGHSSRLTPGLQVRNGGMSQTFPRMWVVPRLWARWSRPAAPSRAERGPPECWLDGKLVAVEEGVRREGRCEPLTSVRTEARCGHVGVCPRDLSRPPGLRRAGLQARPENLHPTPPPKPAGTTDEDPEGWDWQRVALPFTGSWRERTSPRTEGGWGLGSRLPSMAKLPVLRWGAVPNLPWPRPAPLHPKPDSPRPHPRIQRGCWMGRGQGFPPRPAEGWGLEHRGSLVLGGAEVEDGSGWHPSRGSEGRVRPGPRVLSATPSGPLPCGSSCFISPRVTGPPAWSGGWEGPKSPGTPPTAPSPTVAWPDQAQLRC